MFKNKVVIVTGGSAGIGAATAELFAKEGASLAIVGRNEEKLKNVSTLCEQHGAETLIIKADVSKNEDAKTIVDKTVARFGRIDILVNNAGVLKIVEVTEVNILEAFDEMINTNLRAVVHITMLAVPYLKKTKGNVVNVSSCISTSIPSFCPGMTPYGITKAGLDHYTRGAALSLAAFGVRINCVNPGPVLTEMLANIKSPNVEDQYAVISNGTLLSRASQPEEIADMILYLASDKARGVTGSCFFVDNGSILK